MALINKFHLKHDPMLIRQYMDISNFRTQSEPTEWAEVKENRENLEKIQHYFRTLSQILNDLNSLGPWGKQGKDVLRNHDLHKYV